MGYTPTNHHDAGTARVSQPPDQPGETPIRVLIVDDHPAIREALATTISDQPDMVLAGAASSAAEAMEQAKELSPDVVVIDISLRDAHGLELVSRLHEEGLEAQAVIFSIYDENLYAERAIQAGALGYVMKTESTQSVASAIRSVHEGNVYVSRRIASQILGKVVRRQQHNLGATVEELTDREMAVFQMLGEGVGVRDIAQQLSLSRKTVETYRRRAKEKLGFESIPELLQYAVQWTCGREHSR